MIVPYQDILELVGVSESLAIEKLHIGIEQSVKSWMQWEPESVTHTGKLYDGSGNRSLWLDELHIQRVTRVATGAVDAISIKNTSSDASNAYVEVTSVAVRLVVDDGANVDDTITLFADYATITLMVAQLNTIGKGWSAEVTDSDLGPYNSSTLLQTDGKFVGTFDGSTAQFDFLVMAQEPLTGWRIYKERGEIHSKRGFPWGNENIAVNYVSGWTTVTMPGDLYSGVVSLVKQWYGIDTSGTAGLKSYTVGQVTEVFDTGSSGKASISGLTDEAIMAAIPSSYRKIGAV